jgi:hypothetical protein
MMMFNFYVRCAKDDPDAVEVLKGGLRSAFGKFTIRRMSSQEIGRLFEVVGKWYANEEYKNSPIEAYIEKEAGFDKVYTKLNRVQSVIAGTEPMFRINWLIEAQDNTLDYRAVYIPFSFEDMPKMITYQVEYFVKNAIRPLHG